MLWGRTDLTYMDTLGGCYSNSRHADRGYRPRAAGARTCPAPGSTEWETELRTADCGGHSKVFHYRVRSRGHSIRKGRSQGRSQGRIHIRRRRSIRRQRGRRTQHRRTQLRWQRNASACCSRPWSCWRSAAGRRPVRRRGRGSTGTPACPGRRIADTCPAAHCASRSRRWCT